MVVVADEPVVDQSPIDKSYHPSWTRISPSPRAAEFKTQQERQDIIVVVAGLADIYAEIDEPNDDNLEPKSVLFGKEALASQLYHAVSYLYEEYKSPDSFNLVLMYDEQKIPLKFENKPIMEFGLQIGSDSIMTANIAVNYHNEIENGQEHDKINEKILLENNIEPDRVIEFQIMDGTLENGFGKLPWGFLVSPSTTVSELYKNVIHMYAKDAPENTIKLQYLHQTMHLPSDESRDKTMKEEGFHFTGSRTTYILELIDASYKTSDCMELRSANKVYCSKSNKKFLSKALSDNFTMHMSQQQYNRKKSKKEQTENDDDAGTAATKSEMVYVGLVNQAMTCYLNSLLQALYMTSEFRNALYNWEYVDGLEKDEANSIPYQLQKLFLNLQTSTKAAVETTSLTKSFGWDSTEAWQQHDIQELCRVMFDALEQKFKNTKQADLINRLYEGKMIDYVKCLECSTEKSREDAFLDIPLPVKPFGSNVAYNSVEEAMRAFVQPETLDGVNQYFCETCNKKCDAHKGLKFTKFPYLLTLHLKRFDFDYNTFHRIKLNDKVTFPDILNLNSFIPSSENQELSPTTEEDPGVGVKCDDSSTTDSANLDECPPCAITENGINNEPTSEYIVNNEQDDDEGIDVSNGPSTSSTEHSQDNDHRHRSMSGPYKYELFSIMIHSGSASGGHYYAYIKDFRTNEWLCFNDQNVTPITYQDIQKTYGGGPTRGYYSGAYSSSTNAYMLMYRQIDPERNTLPMEVDNFPKHIQELLVKMKEYEEEKRTFEDRSTPMFSIKVYLHHPTENVLKWRKLFSVYEETLAEMVDKVHLTFDLEHIVDLDQCRLVIYDATTDTIESCFDERDSSETLGTLLQQSSRDMLLEIRKKDEQFERYLPGGIGTKVFLFDCIKMDIIDGPIYVRGRRAQPILEYKEQVGKLTDINPQNMMIVLQKFPNKMRIIEEDYNQLTHEGFVSDSRVFISNTQGVSEEQLKNVTELTLNAMLDKFESIISLDAELPDTSSEILEELNIPSLASQKNENNETKDEKVNEKTNVDNQKEKDDTVTSRDSSVSWSGGGEQVVAPPDNEEWQEQSNSEDSSLSDSDRTLVGDASEDDDFGLARIDREWCSHRHVDNKQDIWELDQDDLQANYFFKATPYTKDDKKFLRILVDKRINVCTFRKHLERYVGVPTDCFKVLRQAMDSTDVDLTRLSASLRIWDDGEKITIKLGRALRVNEFRMRVHKLDLENPTPYSFLFEWTVSKDATVGTIKEQLLNELKRKHNYDIPFERCRLRKKNYQIPSKILFNDQKIKDVGLQSQCELIMQELSEDEPVKSPNETIIMVRKKLPNAKIFGPVEEIVLQEKCYQELAEKIAKLSSIPLENLQVTKGKWPCDVYGSRRYWSSAKEMPWPYMNLEDGAIIFYKDAKEKWQANTPEEMPIADTERPKDTQATRRVRRYCQARVLDYGDSPRRERALKIYLDDK